MKKVFTDGKMKITILKSFIFDWNFRKGQVENRKRENHIKFKFAETSPALKNSFWHIQ